MKRQRTDDDNEDVDNSLLELYSFSELIPEMHALVCSFLSLQERSALALTCSLEYYLYPGDKSKLIANCIVQLTQHGNFTGAVEIASDLYHPTLRRWIHESQTITWSLDDDTDDENVLISNAPSNHSVMVSSYFEAQCRQHYPPSSFSANPYMCFGRLSHKPESYQIDRAFARKLLESKYHGLIPLVPTLELS